MVNISRAYELKDGLFEARLTSLDEETREYYIQSSFKYQFLKGDSEMLLMKITSQKGQVEDVFMKPSEVNTVIDNTINKLLELELYEQCAVLKTIKDTFNIRYIG
jgi:hypothetical protein